MSDQNTFLFQVNVTRDCNLRCTHCYISSDKKAQSQYMSESELLDTFSKIADFLIQDQNGSYRYNMADIHIIGGEPTMLGKSFYEKVMPKINDILAPIDRSKTEVKLSIVTNLVTKDAVDIASMFDMVATSYEKETRFVSTSGRPLPAVEKMWETNVRRLQDLSIPVTVTTAVTNQVISYGAKNLLNDYLNMGFKQVHLGFFIPSGDGLINIDSVFPTFDQTSQFMIEATDWYLSHRDAHKDLYVNPIESMIESIHSGKPIDDIVCPIIPGSLDIDWNGETVTCIEAGGEVDAISLGNVFDRSIIDVLNDRPYRYERLQAIKPKPHCVGCDELQNCQSACGVLHSYWDGEDECPGFKRFIKYIRSLVDGGLLPKSVIAANEFRSC